MIGTFVIIVVLVIALPVGVLISGMVAAAILGWLLKSDGEDNAASPELVELNR